MKPSAALSKAAKAAESQAQTLIDVERKLDLIMVKLGIVEVTEVVVVPSEPEPESEVVVVEPVVEAPAEAEDKPAKKKK